MKYLIQVFILSMAAYAAAQFYDVLWFTLVSKFFASGSFFIAALIFYKKAESHSADFVRFSKTIILGLFFSVVADILLEIVFEIGFVFFILAQVSYFIALMKFRKPGKKACIVFAILDVLLFVTEYVNPLLDFGVLLIPLFIYISFVLANSVFSFYLFKNKSRCAKLLPLGLILFFVSDYILQFKLFGSFSDSVNLVFRVANVFTYFPGQLLIALSLKEDFSE